MKLFALGSLLAAVFGTGLTWLVVEVEPAPDKIQVRATGAATSRELEESQASVKEQITAHLIGTSNCSTSNCHGASAGELSRQASRIWATADPHRQAYHVLYTERSVQIIEQLERERIDPKLDSERYVGALQKRCNGCHATASSREVDITQGVSCESCHGPASEWLATHDTKAFADGAGRDVSGFIDQRVPHVKAKTCAGCHVGPMVVEGQTFDVNHELIAAGHPRLAFELTSYYSQLPRHWNERVAARGAEGKQVQMWLEGRLAFAEKKCQLLDADVANGKSAGRFDFARYECRDCHHSIDLLPRPRGTLGAPRIDATWLKQLAEQQSAARERPLEILRDHLTRASERDWDELMLALQGARALTNDLAGDPNRSGAIENELKEIERIVALAAPKESDGNYGLPHWKNVTEKDLAQLRLSLDRIAAIAHEKAGN